MKTATAIAKISRRIDGVRSHTEPGQVFLCEDADYPTLLAAGAIREPTDAEVSLFSMSTGKAAGVTAKRAEPSEAPPPKGDEQPKLAMKAKKKGQAFVVTDETDAVVSGDEIFATRDAALDWIEMQATQASAEDLLS